MKKLRMLLLALFVLIGGFTLNAIEVDGINYDLNTDTHEATVTGEEYSGSVVIPSTISVGDVVYTVTSIGYKAFNGCSGLTSITIPNSVTSIETWAFYGCNGLTNITIPEGVTSIGNVAFYGCSGLTNITIPEGVISIGDYAFCYCSSLTDITLLEGIASIGSYAFYGCSGLTSITIPKEVMSIGVGAFSGCDGLTSIMIKDGNEYYDSRNNCNAIIKTETNTLIIGCKNTIIPSSITSIGERTFYNCDGLTNITIPEGVTSIEKEAFYNCDGLTDITIPSSITSIGERTFYNCDGLTNITISEGVTSIEKEAFYDCSGLTNITIPSSITSIGESAFYNCNGLTNITISEGVTSIGKGAFYGCSGLTNITIPEGVISIGDYAFCYCSGLTSITIPEGVTSIGKGAFYGCSGLTNITISEGVTSIGEGAFYGCSGLTNITIPEGVISIGDYTFYECSGLTSITIPEGVTSIGKGAFYGCSGLTSITIPEGVTSIGDHTFYECSGLTSITIPNSVTSFGENVFGNSWYNSHLKYIKMCSSTPPAVAEGIFDCCPNYLVIEVPEGATENYNMEPWNNYRIIEGGGGGEYALWMPNLKTRPTKPITLSIQLNNVAAISDYQFDLYIPEGFSIAKDEEGLDMIYLSNARTDERQHTFAYNTIYDGALRVICYSNSTATFSGNEGEVLTITLDVAEDVVDGEYSLYLKNIEMTEPDGIAHKASDYPCKVTVISYTPGDVNDDGNFSVTDVRGIVNMVLKAQVPDDNLAGDVNEDGVISVTDVRGAVNLVLNPVASTAMLSPKMRAATSSTNLLYIEPFAIAPGEEKEVLVMLNNPGDAFSDIQFDLYLPDGIEVVQDEIGYFIDLGSRTSSRKHNLPEAALQYDGAVRVLCYTNKDYVFSGESGDVMVITLKADDNLSAGVYSFELKNVELARPDMTNDKPQAYAASVLSGQVQDKSVTINGYLSAEAMSELSTTLATAKNVASVDISSAIYVDAAGTLTTGNPNTLVILADGMAIGNSQNVVVNGVCENLSLSDAHPFYAPASFTADNFTFERIFTEAKVASFVLPTEIPTSAVNGKVYKLTGVNGNVLKFSEVTSGMLESNMPYMVEVSAAGELLSGTLSNITVAATSAEIVNIVDNVQHIGAYQQQEVVSDALCTYYGFTGGEFVKANNGTLKPFRTMIAAGNASLTNKYLLDFSNGTTGIYGIGGEVTIGESYDLSGRKVVSPAKGVYIINGKKIIVK